MKFKSNITTTSISLEDSEILISKTIVNDLLSDLEKTDIPTGMTGKEDGEEHKPKEDEKQEGQEEKKEGEKQFKRIFLRIEGIPATKIADLNRGVLMPLSREAGSFKFNMEIDIDSSDGISEQMVK